MNNIKKQNEDSISVDNKEDFIAKLSSMTKEEINDFIMKNGKPPKPIPLFIKHFDS